VAALLAVFGYFGLLLVPEWLPAFGGTGFFFLYLLSLPVALLALVGLGLWGGIGLLRAEARGLLAGRARARLLVATVGVLWCVAALGLVRLLPRPLPTGSHRLAFNAELWRDPRSAEYVQDDATPRQKMLAEVVEKVLPGRTRAEIEGLLGPSLETFYFRSTGRDLIYPLGPERDVYLGLDSEWLLIWLDDAGRFRRYAIAND
jgi:hypothetical protein